MDKLKQLIADALSGKSVDFDKLDYKELGQERAVVELAVKSAVEAVEVAELPEQTLKKKAASLIENARKDEQQKLYDTLGDLKESNRKLNERLNADDKAKQDEEARKKAEEEAKRKESLSAKDAVQELETRFTSVLNETNSAWEKRIAEQDAAHRGEVLKLYRERIVAESKGEIIEELLTGNTPEELIQSAEKARARYNEIVGKAKESEKNAAAAKLAEEEAAKKKAEEDRIRMGFPGSSDGAPSKGRAVAPAEIRNASAEQLAKVKDEVLSKLGF